MTERIASLADVRPGDIGLMRMPGLIPGTFPVRVGTALCKESFRIGPFSADHALICVEVGNYPRTEKRPRAVQAMPRGAEEIALTAEKHWTDGVVWFRMPEDYPDQAQDAAAIARLFVTEKVPYSFVSYVALAAWSWGLKAERLEEWIGRRREPPVLIDLASWPEGPSAVPLPEEAICSVLVDQAWSLAGKRVMHGVAHQAVTPGALAIRLNSMPGVLRAGPGFLAEQL